MCVEITVYHRGECMTRLESLKIVYKMWKMLLSQAMLIALSHW
jgi:hypothetical protein